MGSCECAKETIEQDKAEFIKPPIEQHNDFEGSLKNQISNSFVMKGDDYKKPETNSQSFNCNQIEEKIVTVFAEKALEIINKIRKDPKHYADVIEDSTQYITETDKNKLIFKKKIKIALFRGLPAFEEAAKILRKMDPVPPLELKNEIILQPPRKESDMKSLEYIQNQVKNIRNSYNIEVYYKDWIKDPDISVLWMIVDDNGKNEGKKRNAVLNPEFKYIGISSREVGKSFISYFSFGK